MAESLRERTQLEQEFTVEEAIAFSQLGDQLFKELASRIATRQDYRLLYEHTLKPDLFQQIQAAAAEYISACLDGPIIRSQADLLERLLAAKGSLPNYMGTGLLMPKREHILEFNRFQRSVANAFRQLGANDLIDAVDLPVNLRIVYGKMDAANLRLPFTSTKRHSDVWAGVAADATVVVLPLFGDIENITIAAGEMPREMELSAMRVMSDFDEGRDIPMVVSYDNAKLQHGTMYFNDARGLHQTVRHISDGVRVSVDFRFRRKFNEVYRAMIPLSSGGVEADMSVPYGDWLKVGTDTLIVFDESVEQARARKANPGPVPLYTRNYRTVEIFNSPIAPL